MFYLSSMLLYSQLRLRKKYLFYLGLSLKEEPMFDYITNHILEEIIHNAILELLIYVIDLFLLNPYCHFNHLTHKFVLDHSHL